MHSTSPVSSFTLLPYLLGCGLAHAAVGGDVVRAAALFLGRGRGGARASSHPYAREVGQGAASRRRRSAAHGVGKVWWVVWRGTLLKTKWRGMGHGPGGESSSKEREHIEMGVVGRGPKLGQE
jgi:hypothetical protein